MDQLLITQGSGAVVPFVGPRPPATHEVRWFFRHDHHHDHDELLGRITTCWSDDREQRRIESITLRIQFALQCPWNRLRRDIVPLSSVDKVRRSMSDLQRFRRKMGMVLNAYNQQRTAILQGQHGIPEFALERLDHELSLAWDKAQRIYGFTKNDYQPATP
jgi:hypothetical protein